MFYKDSCCYNYDKKDERKEKEDHCVEINIRCGEQEDHKKDEKPYIKPDYDEDSCKKEDYDKKPNDKKERSCVVINIYCEEKEGKDKDTRPKQL